MPLRASDRTACAHSNPTSEHAFKATSCACVARSSTIPSTWARDAGVSGTCPRTSCVLISAEITSKRRFAPAVLCAGPKPVLDRLACRYLAAAAAPFASFSPPSEAGDAGRCDVLFYSFGVIPVWDMGALPARCELLAMPGDLPPMLGGSSEGNSGRKSSVHKDMDRCKYFLNATRRVCETFSRNEQARGD